jgi:predicted secreted protein with PEFG-CTERM motif
LITVGGLSITDSFAATDDFRYYVPMQNGNGDDGTENGGNATSPEPGDAMDGETTEEDGDAMDGETTEEDGDAMDGETTEEDGDAMDGETTEEDGDAMDGETTEEDGDAMDGEKMDDKMMMDEEMMAMIMEQPLYVGTDATEYTAGDDVKIYGHIQHLIEGNAVALTVQSPLGNSIIEVRQITPDEEGSFSTTIKTTSGAWQNDGDYVISVQYSKETSSTTISVASEVMPGVCGDGELTLNDEWCIPYTITGGSVTGVSANLETTSSLVFTIAATGDGEFTISPSEDVMNEPLIVFVDGEESDDAVIDGNTVTVPITADTETVEVFATFVVPEFGTIAALILGVAIISIIAVSARSRLSITPKY